MQAAKSIFQHLENKNNYIQQKRESESPDQDSGDIGSKNRKYAKNHAIGQKCKYIHRDRVEDKPTRTQRQKGKRMAKRMPVYETLT